MKTTSKAMTKIMEDCDLKIDESEAQTETYDINLKHYFDFVKLA
jgi:hypothetical protein